MRKQNIGSRLDDLLQEEAVPDEVTAAPSNMSSLGRSPKK